jgi:ribose 5-phosphate isomerase B
MKLDRRILIASDHAGWALKSGIIRGSADLNWIDLGPENEARVDYPDYAELLGEQILQGKAPRGILICGSGIGMSIAANKIPGIRAAMVENPVSARLAREHNRANVLCLGARFTAVEYGIEIIQAWLNATEVQDARHTQRIDKIHALETRYVSSLTAPRVKPGQGSN